jgi:hypothetical protein
MYVALLQGINFKVCDYKFKSYPNIDILYQAVIADNFFEAGAELGIFMPTGRKRKYAVQAAFHVC